MQADLLINNVNLATFADAELGIIENATIAFQNGRIIAINQTQISATKTIDAKKQWLLPCFIDCHTHLVYAGNRAHEFSMRLEGKSYAEIAKAGGGIKSTVAATRKASFAELYKLSNQRLQNLINEGVGVCEIKSGYGLDLENEIKILAVAKKLATENKITIQKTFLGAHTLPSEYTNADQYIEYLVKTVLAELANENLVDAIDAYCETIAFTPEQLKPLFEAAKLYHLPIKLHAEQLSNFGGTQFAANYKAISVDHLEYANEADVQAMAQAKSVAVLLPGAFYYLNETQKPPIELLRKYLVPMAIATDANPGTSPTTSILLMLNMACVLFRLTPIEALRGIAINAAKALKLQKDHGSLVVGKRADCCLWEIEHPLDLVYHIGSKAKCHRIYQGEFVNDYQ